MRKRPRKPGRVGGGRGPRLSPPTAVGSSGSYKLYDSRSFGLGEGGPPGALRGGQQGATRSETLC